jgi:uncharacterized protein YoxC
MKKKPCCPCRENLIKNEINELLQDIYSRGKKIETLIEDADDVEKLGSVQQYINDMSGALFSINENVEKL